MDTMLFTFIITALALTVTILALYTLNGKVDFLMEKVEHLDNKLNTSTHDQALEEQLQKWLDEWEIGAGEVTGYAPLDPSAVAGMCYEGDPGITASGEKVVPGVTVAAGPSIPFGTKVYIQGLGWRTVHDRGGMISRGKWDVAMPTQTEALRFGRQRLRVIHKRG